MLEYIKLASFLDSFDKSHPDYDAVCFIKQKIAEQFNTVNNGESEELLDTDITMTTPEQKSQKNQEGALMTGAFSEMDIQNKIDEEKDQIDFSQKNQSNPEIATTNFFGNNALNKKEASFYDLIKFKFKK
jgi:hypothetical protein